MKLYEVKLSNQLTLDISASCIGQAMMKAKEGMVKSVRMIAIRELEVVENDETND